ncbi:MAG: sensor histidine kinase [Planctomycetota bacterium]|jgi:PAS domain S-box-containing protein
MPDPSLFDSLLIGLVTIDASGVIQAFNPAASDMFGYAPEEALGVNVSMLMPEPYRGAHDGYIAQYLLTGEGRFVGRHRELVARRKDGSVFPCELGVVELPPDETLGRRFVATLRDVTAAKEDERKLIAARGAAERANKTKSQFLANMSHELRTPLNAIIGYSEMLGEVADERGLQEFSDDLGRIRAAGHQLLEMINSVLEVSKIESGRMELHLEGFDVEQVVRGVLDTIRPQAEKAGNTLIVNLGYDLGSMVADRIKVWQSLLNLVSNACKFTSDGTIEVQVHRYLETEAGPGGAPRERSWIAFQVRDTGIGISPEQLDRLFHAFAQGDPSTTRKYGGTGLGLVIAEKFCKLMGGRVEAESELGEGSTFTLRLPAQVVKKRYRITESGNVYTDVTDQLLQQRERIEAELEGPEDAATVLLIEDDLGLTDLITRMLEAEGLRVKATRSGQDGLGLAEILQPCAIVIDTSLPGSRIGPPSRRRRWS